MAQKSLFASDIGVYFNTLTLLKWNHRTALPPRGSITLTLIADLSDDYCSTGYTGKVA